MATKSSWAKLYDRLHKALIKLAADPVHAEGSKQNRAEAIRLLNTRTSDGKIRPTYGLISGDLSRVAIPILAKGATQVLDGNPEGWREIRLGHLLRSWAARFRHGFINQDECWNSDGGSTAIFSRDESLVLCQAICTGEERFALGFGRLLLANLKRTGGGDRVYFYTLPIHTFAIKLFATWVAEPVEFRPDVKNPLKHYQAIFDAWDSVEDLGSAILQACDIHCEEARTPRDESILDYPPYCLFPVEILAIFKIRDHLGLPNPVVTHPLLETPLARPPATPPDVEDELLSLAEARFRSDFPEGPLAF